MREAIRNALLEDSELQSLGFDEDRIWPNFALDGSPRTGKWLVLRFGQAPGRWGKPGGAAALSVWAYASRMETTDHNDLSVVLDSVERVLMGMEHYQGGSHIITTVRFSGRSEDLNDEGYDAIAMNSAFSVVFRPA